MSTTLKSGTPVIAVFAVNAMIQIALCFVIERWSSCLILSVSYNVDAFKTKRLCS
jgi:hypothetical protein